MIEEFNLSEKELWMQHKETNQECCAFPKEDVKEFINRLKDKFKDKVWYVVREEIDKLAGDKLSQSGEKARVGK